MMTTDLARHEERAQRGILEFADEMTLIRDQNLYPNANGTTDGDPAWKAYCQERWGMGHKYVNDVIIAAPVIRRRDETAADGRRLSVSAARRVATLDVEVQNAILDETTDRDEVQTKATAAKNAVKAGLPVEAQIEAAQAIPTKPKAKKRKAQKSRFIKLLGPAWTHLQDSAIYVQTNTLSEMENDWGWVVLERMKLELERIQDQLHRPITVRDVDAEAAFLLGEAS
jgi:hypothetical protein